MRVLFLGNHTVGVRTLAALAATEEVVGVVAHPVDPEDGFKYESVYDYARGRGWHTIRSAAKDARLQEFVRAARPDLIWITDYRYLLDRSVLTVAGLGTINLHPSLLPQYRGRAPINWAILNGEKTLGLTAHFVDDGMDTGDIIAQELFELREDQDVGDALDILYPIYARIARRVLTGLRAGRVPRQPQDHSKASVFPRRRREDGRIDWNRSVRSVFNLIRAVAAPYPGAFTTWRGAEIMVWKAVPVAAEAVDHLSPGTVLRVNRDGIDVRCRDGALRLSRVEWPEVSAAHQLTVGEVLQ